ncbi:MAG: flagellar biosynthesis anti-sigma factor FlgM [Desulfomonilia bacterium]|jgi:negative regulator of flagellin synthesis FlgM
MKVDNTTNIEALKTYGTSAAERPHQGREAGEKNHATLSIKDKINISPKVRMFQDIKQAVNDAPDIRTDKVNEVSKQIVSKTYSPDYKLIADKLLSNNISAKI